MIERSLAVAALTFCGLFCAYPVPSQARDTPAERPGSDRREPAAARSTCIQQAGRREGLGYIAPYGTGAEAYNRDCVVLTGERQGAQVGRTIEVSDGARGPVSGPSIATAASGSYALSLINARPGWSTSTLTGEADGLSVFVRQARGDTAAYLSNVGVRSGFAATLESYTFAADAEGHPTRAVRAQLGVVNPRDGGEYGLVLQAADGDQLSAGLRIASLGTATWKNYLEVVSPAGETLVSVRGSDGAIVSGDLLPGTDLHKTIGSPQARYAATYTRVLQLAATAFADLPKCAGGEGAGTLAYVSDVRQAAKAWNQVVSDGGGKYRVFVKCDGSRWTTF